MRNTNVVSNNEVESVCYFHAHDFDIFSQKNKGRKKHPNSEMDKDVRRRKADELREYVYIQCPSEMTKAQNDVLILLIVV